MHLENEKNAAKYRIVPKWRHFETWDDTYKQHTKTYDMRQSHTIDRQNV